VIEVNFVGSAAVPRIVSIACEASCAATTRLRVFPDTMIPFSNSSAAPRSAIISTVTAATTSMTVKPSGRPGRVSTLASSSDASAVPTYAQALHRNSGQPA